MEKVYLSKSRYCRAKQCNKMFWLDKYKPEEKVQTASDDVFENGNKVGELAKQLFGEYVDIPFDKDLSTMLDATASAMKNKPNIITEASFNYDNNFCSVDILKNDEDGVEIYEVKSSTQIRDVYYDDVAYQYYVLSNLGLNIKKACLVHLNNEYIRNGELEIDKLFSIEDFTEIAIQKQEEVKENIEKLNKVMQEHNENNEPKIDLGVYCMNPYACEYWGYCTRKLPTPNVFDVRGRMWFSKKIEKYYEGKISFEDLINENLSEVQLEQIDFALNNKPPKINIEVIKNLMNTLKYPLYFLDFETFKLPIPEYDGTWPYEQLPFQYSLHIAREAEGELEHKEFLAEADDNEFMRHFAETLVRDIPENGSVIVYNEKFEKTIMAQLAERFPDLADELNRIIDNVVDFLPPFRNRDYYMKEMNGSASIKAVLPALYPDDPELDYHKLPVVHNGSEASEIFATLKEKSKEEQEQIRKGLLLYCGLDTYAMVKIWQRFKELIGEE